MRIKKIPMRTCVITHEKLPKKELLRIVKTPEGFVEVDLMGKKNGRGAYIKKDLNVLDLAKKNKSLEKHLEISIEDKVYEEIKNVIKNN